MDGYTTFPGYGCALCNPQYTGTAILALACLGFVAFALPVALASFFFSKFRDGSEASEHVIRSFRVKLKILFVATQITGKGVSQ